MEQFSQKYFGDKFTKKQHKKINKSFQKDVEQLNKLKEGHEGIAFSVRVNGKTLWFNKDGEEVDLNWIQDQFPVGGLV